MTLAAQDINAAQAGFIILLALFSLLPAIFGFMVGKAKGQAVAGLLLGFFLSWLGLIVAVLMPYNPYYDPRARFRQPTRRRPARKRRSRHRV